MSDLASDISTLTIYENNENPASNGNNQKYSFSRKQKYSFSKKQKYSVGLCSEISQFSEKVQPYLLCFSLLCLAVLLPIVIINYTQQNKLHEKLKNLSKMYSYLKVVENMAVDMKTLKIRQNDVENRAIIPGLKGSLGLKGEQGIPGTQGEIGEKGERGAKGIPGLSGIKGTKGNQGIIGLKGDQGIQGIPGHAGMKGDKVRRNGCYFSTGHGAPKGFQSQIFARFHLIYS